MLPNNNFITRKRKKYKFAEFERLDNCFELDQISESDLSNVDILEIGAGTADFSVGLAQIYPDKNLLALDIKGDRLQTGAKKALELGLDNLNFVRAYVDKFDQSFTSPKLDQLWITFCDPFPKDRSAKHRLTHNNFLKLYRRWLGDNGKLCFKTDNQKLFEFSVEELKNNCWNIVEKTTDLHSSDLNENYKITTNYERRYMAKNQSIYFLIAQAD